MNSLWAVCLWIAILSILLALDSKGVAEGHRASGTGQTSSAANHHGNSAIARPPTTTILSQTIEFPRDGSTTERSADDIEIQRLLAKYTKYLVWVGAIQALVLAGTLLLIWRQASLMGIHAEHLKDVAKAALLNARAVINSERPWLVVRPFIEKSDAKLCLFGCHNHGVTPAKIISASARYEFVSSLDGLLQPPDYSAPIALPDLTLIVHHDSFPIGHGVDAESLIGGGEARSLVEEGRKFLVYYGNVVYRDVLYPESEPSGHHETRWCFVYMLNKEGNIKFHQTGPEGYNRYT